MLFWLNLIVLGARLDHGCAGAAAPDAFGQLANHLPDRPGLGAAAADPVAGREADALALLQAGQGDGRAVRVGVRRIRGPIDEHAHLGP